VIRVLVDAGANVNQATTDDGTTPLFISAREGHTDVVEMLVYAGADVCTARVKGATPLSVAMGGMHTAIADILRAGGALVVQVHLCSCDGQACSCTRAQNMTGPRWHKTGEGVDLCSAAFDQLPEAEKLLFECIQYPGDEPVPYNEMLCNFPLMEVRSTLGCDQHEYGFGSKKLVVFQPGV
jgi:hypothetical protein